MTKKFVLAIDQGTTSSRAILFTHQGTIHSVGQLEHDQIFPQAGWVEHNADQIWNNVREVVGLALTRGNATYDDVAAVGITNQRETAVVWDKNTGKPVYNAIVWQDTRTQKLLTNSVGTKAQTGTRNSPVCLWLPTSLGQRSSGSSTMLMVPGKQRTRVTCCLGPLTRGCCGT